MEHRDEAEASARTAETVEAHDRRWRADVRGSVRCAAALLALLLLVDGVSGTLTWSRGALWAALALLLLLVLFPARVSAGPGWLASRRLLRTRRVRTDRLAAVDSPAGVSRRLVLRDTLGARVELDPGVLMDNPGLWYRLYEDARLSEASGTLRRGANALHALAERVDRETALGVFRVSGLK